MYVSYIFSDKYCLFKKKKLSLHFDYKSTDFFWNKQKQIHKCNENNAKEIFFQGSCAYLFDYRMLRFVQPKRANGLVCPRNASHFGFHHAGIP